MKRNKLGQFEKLYEVNESFFNERGDVQAYLIGLLLSDGSISKNQQSFTISQSGEKGKNLIGEIKNILNFTGPIKNYKNSYSIFITSKRLVESLKEYNIVPNKTYNVSYPENLDDSYFFDFLRGYIDGDGSVGIYDNGMKTHYIVISIFGTKDLIYKIKEKVNENDISGNIRHKYDNFYEIRYYGEKAIKLGRLLWRNKSLPIHYKQKIYEEFILKYDTRYLKYFDIKNIIILELKNGEKPSILSKKYNIKESAIWNWKYRNL